MTHFILVSRIVIMKLIAIFCVIIGWINGAESLRALQNFCPDRNQISLFTPGPVTTTKTVRQSMAEDIGLDQKVTRKLTQFIRQSTLAIAGVKKEKYTSIILQGSGTYGIEASLLSSLPKKGGKILILTNGYFGDRLITLCEYGSIPHDVIRWRFDEEVNVKQIETHLSKVHDYTAVMMVHHETNWGIVNPIQKVGQIVKKKMPDAAFIVDAVSSFICLPINIVKANIDFLIFSANKCLQGIPGFAIIIANKNTLLKTKGWSRVYGFDLYSQNEGLEKLNLFRFTSPVQVFLAAQQAIKQLMAEGISNRIQRYERNSKIIRAGMKRLGFQQIIAENRTTYVVTAYYQPQNVDFERFESKLEEKGFAITARMTSKEVPLFFRIGHIGDLRDEDCKRFLDAVEKVLKEMKVRLPLKHLTK